MFRCHFHCDASSEEELASICELVESKGFSVLLIARNYNDPSNKPPAGEPYGFEGDDYSFHGATFYIAPKNFDNYESFRKSINELNSHGINLYSTIGC